LTSLRAGLPRAAADCLHYGATSQDIIDTAMVLCAKAALDPMAEALTGLIAALETLARAEADTLMLARTRGQLATPIPFGLRVAQWAQPLIALRTGWQEVRRAALRVQLGGSSGSRSVMAPKGEAVATALAQTLELEDGPPWHTDRGGLRRLAQWMARSVAAAARIGRDISLSTRAEIAELRLQDGGGSSTMPHKSNPILAEALQSLGPIAASQEAALAASAIHAEERDGAYWPVEWLTLPRLLETTGAALDKCADLIARLEVDRSAMAQRVRDTPAVRAEAAVFALIPALGRVEATRAVTQHLKTGNPLVALLQSYGVEHAEARLSDASDITAAKAVIDRIFANA